MARREKRKRGAHERKYARREVLKGAARTGVYAGVGAGAGAVYRAGRDFLRFIGDKIRAVERVTGNALYDIDNEYDARVSRLEKSKNPVVRGAGKTAKGVKKAEGWRARLYRRLAGRSEEDQRKWREDRKIGEYAEPPRPSTTKPTTRKKPIQYAAEQESEKTNRRGFFRTILGLAHDHPVAAGATTGATYGAGKSVVKTYADRGKGREIARLRDDNEELRERVSKLEKGGKKKKEDLEDRVEGPPKTGKAVTLIAVGLLGVILSIILSVSKVTGYAVQSGESVDLGIINLVLFIVSLVALFISRWV